MEAPWRIELLGRLRAVRGDQVVSHFRSRNYGALLAYMAYDPERVHARDVLVELLWPDCLPEVGRTNLRQGLASLRRQLGDSSVILTDRSSVRLRPGSVRTDVADFEEALKAALGSAGTPSLLERALELYRGNLLPDLDQEWVTGERARLRA